MSTFAEDLREDLYEARSIAGCLGLRPYRVSVTIRANDGTYGLRGSATDTTVDIREADGQPPKFRFATEDEIALGAAEGQCTVGPITPDFAAGGYTIAELTGAAAAASNLVYFTVTGPRFTTGKKYKLAKAASDHALHYTITLSPIT